MRLFAAALAVVAIWPAIVQANGRLEAAERKMASAYAALVGKLDGPAKGHLEADQTRFLGDRSACDANLPRKVEVPGSALSRAH